MKNFIFLLGAFAIVFVANGQDKDASVNWDLSISNKDAESEEELEIIFKARIPENWYLFSSDFSPDLGPKVTTFFFEPDPGYAIEGEIVPINPKKKYDDLWEGEYTYFTNTAEFRQNIKLNGKAVVVKGYCDFQICSDIDGKCIPYKEHFSITVGK